MQKQPAPKCALGVASPKRGEETPDHRPPPSTASQREQASPSIPAQREESSSETRDQPGPQREQAGRPLPDLLAAENLQVDPQQSQHRTSKSEELQGREPMQ